MFYQPRRSARKFQPSPGHRWARKFLAVVMAASLTFIGLLNTAQAGNCALDPTFGKGGIAGTDFGRHDGANAAALQSDGKIVAAGWANNTVGGESIDFAVARFNPNGTLDSSFGNGGKVLTDFFGNPDYAQAVAIQADHKIVVAGNVHAAIGAWEDFGLARYNSDGSLDDGSANDSTPGDSFGNAGKVSLDIHGVNERDIVGDIALQSDGKIVVVGLAILFARRDFAIARYNTDGSLDDGSPSDSTPADIFGTDGKVILSFTGIIDSVRSVAIQPADNKIIVAGGAASTATLDFALARYETDGTLDPTFGNGGIVTTDFNHMWDVIADIALQPDGRIVAAGVTQGSGPTEIAIARDNTDGSLDKSFGSGGQIITEFAEGTPGNFATAVALQPADGKIVVGGFIDKGNIPTQINEAFAAARYNTDGTPDTSFDEDGRTVTDIRGAEDGANDVLIQPDGNIVLVGSSVSGANANINFALVRYLGDAADYAPTLDSISIPLNKVPGGVPLTGTVKLCGPAPAGGVKVAFTDTLDSVTVQRTVTVPEGETMANFAVRTQSTLDNEAGSIIAKLGTTTRTTTLVVQKIGLFYLALDPNPVVGPNPTNGAVVLNGRAPAGGITVTLSSKNPGVASPTVSTVFIPEGMQQKNFTIQTHDVPSQRSAIIMATANGTSKSRILIVQ